MNLIITKSYPLKLKITHAIKKNHQMLSISSAINSESGFKSASKSDSKSDSETDSETDSNLVFINLDICIFLSYIYTLLNKLVDDFLSILITEPIVIQAMQVYCIFSLGTSLLKRFVLILLLNSFTLAFKYLYS